MGVLSRQIEKRIPAQAPSLCGLLGTLALFCATLWSNPASAAQPPTQLSFSEIAPNAVRVASFDDGARIDIGNRGDRTFPSHGHIAMVSKPIVIPTPVWPPRDQSHQLLSASAPLEPVALPRKSSWLNRTAWGLAGTGASLLSGALDYRDKSNALQRDYDALPNHASAHRYREVQREIDDARYLMLALYAAGGTVIAESIILLTDDSDDPTDTRAEIAPTWRNGGPAAYLRISF